MRRKQTLSAADNKRDAQDDEPKSGLEKNSHVSVFCKLFTVTCNLLRKFGTYAPMGYTSRNRKVNEEKVRTAISPHKVCLILRNSSWCHHLSRNKNDDEGDRILPFLNCLAMRLFTQRQCYCQMDSKHHVTPI